MIDYLHDGSFDGFLTCLYLHYYEEKAVGIYSADVYQASLLQPSRLVETQQEKANLVSKAIGEKIGQDALRRAYHIHLSDRYDRYNLMLRYLLRGFTIGKSISSLHGDPVVYEAQQTARKVSFEVHRLAGLVRFSVVPGSSETRGEEILYAKIEPDHDILELLGEHFSDRFRSAPFIIHDARRKKALFGYEGEWIIGTVETPNFGTPGREEQEYRRLWKLYYDSIAIEQRKNPRCQKRMMPVRYWKNLTEMKETSQE